MYEPKNHAILYQGGPLDGEIEEFMGPPGSTDNYLVKPTFDALGKRIGDALYIDDEQLDPHSGAKLYKFNGERTL